MRMKYRFTALATWILALLLAGCAQTGTVPSRVLPTSESPVPRPQPSSVGRDIATQSDESETRRRARIRLELATAYYTRGDLRTALDEVKQVLAIEPGFSDAMELRGLIYDLMGEPVLAEESFRRASQLDPRNGSVSHNHGWYLCRKQRYTEADAMFDRALTLPSSVSPAKTLLVKGVCQMRDGRATDAEKTLARAYEQEPSNPATAYNLALALYVNGNVERARFYIRRVNNVPEQANPESLWLGIRIAHKLHNSAEKEELASLLRNKFPNAREINSLELGRFDE
ncbi:type IV pilus biogenesis/stability protein PilW [Aquabacterium lacunae]|uniref:Type IV pilus biogenesis/stability protein PilW n=1 Tax=Aquabacterium lacunae TaxID=2528630 RepID=A0A4Q9GZN2_9BURK|nr:type IV pilus biogenesis/stability protein PilW [Aquabacterium lacunae]TBO32473.1 type IV pilus biogenesis/stability protein PilW [Aquabacterium lacunae]